MPGRNFTPFPILQTGRLTLRQLQCNDAHEVLALRSNPDVNQYLDRNSSKSIEDAQSFIQLVTENIQRKNSIYWAITLTNVNTLIGTICLFNFSGDNAKGEIGYELLPDFHRQGIMQEAASKVIDFGAQHIGLREIAAYTHPENHASTRLLKKLHFKTKSTDEADVILFYLAIEDRH
ncbi:GNAT family N-acetyltransferase [Chitinophaga sedimenti]|uniref:GNAT family N-acetyltransferase n=1 Tax=Chitinophaga sedimenti TaxID=2033606 RepID=UPI002003BB65|nr:GNAT family N-acetyltransferase [Chitinophaga sedimenti]MCK7556001.1 GNAT family N-acetyltransferase [Chitinophaga sedimenti]